MERDGLLGKACQPKFMHVASSMMHDGKLRKKYRVIYAKDENYTPLK